jgi:hypothetical protein
VCDHFLPPTRLNDCRESALFGFSPVIDFQFGDHTQLPRPLRNALLKVADDLFLIGST